MSQTIKLLGYDYDSKNGFYQREVDVLMASPDELNGYSQPITEAAYEQMVNGFLTELEARLHQNQTNADVTEAILDEPVSLTFGKQALQILLSQTGAEAIEFVFAKGADGNTTLIAQAVTIGGNGENQVVKLQDGPPSRFEMAPPTKLRQYRSKQ